MVVADEPPIRRTAAAAVVGRIGHRDVVPALLEALDSPHDELLKHALTFALIEIGDADTTIAGLKDRSLAVRNAAFIALDQMNPSPLTAELIEPFLDSGDKRLITSAVQVIVHRKVWSSLVRDRLPAWLADLQRSPIERPLLQELILALIHDKVVQSQLAAVLTRPDAKRETRLFLLSLIARGPSEVIPEPWVEPLKRALASEDMAIARLALQGILASDATPFREIVLQWARDTRRPADLRIQALQRLLAVATGWWQRISSS